jgi:hypothetical protein
MRASLRHLLRTHGVYRDLYCKSEQGANRDLSGRISPGFELIQFSSNTSIFPSVGLTAIPTVSETTPPVQAEPSGPFEMDFCFSYTSSGSGRYARTNLREELMNKNITAGGGGQTHRGNQSRSEVALVLPAPARVSSRSQPRGTPKRGRVRRLRESRL